jgi:hypothetical protein
MIDPIQLKEVNDLIDNDLEYAHEMKMANLATRICSNCYHYDAWHENGSGGCNYRADGMNCECGEFSNER